VTVEDEVECELTKRRQEKIIILIQEIEIQKREVCEGDDEDDNKDDDDDTNETAITL